MEYLQERQAAHLLEYGGVLKLCVRKLAAIYSNLGLSKDEQLQAFDKIAAAAEHVWTDACENADVERQALRDKVDKDLYGVLKIREALGDDEADLELSQCQEEAASPRVTLRSLHERVQRRLEHWKGRRAERLVEYETIMAVTSSLKSQLGQMQPVTRADLSRANLDFLRMEQDKLYAEKEKRVRRLELLLEQLRAQCQELGESGKEALSEVHHSLWHFRESRQADAAAEEVLKEGAAAMATAVADGSAAAAVGSAGSDVLLQGVELGDAMFERLTAKMEALAQLKAERAAQIQQLSAVLGSLWEALHIAPNATERSAASALMQGPDKLHLASIEACGAEVSRLEQQQSRAMKDLVVAKALELEQLCAASLMAAPDVTELLLEMSQPARRESIGGHGQGHGQVSDVLSKIMRLIVEVRSETAKRSGLVAQVKELQEAQQELAWLHKYEHDENRFKGRDAHSNLQRSLRAAKLRERVPPLVRGLQQAAQGWRLREGAPFLVNGQDYAEEVLPEVSRQLEQSLAEKAMSAKAKHATTGGGSSSGNGSSAAANGGGKATATAAHPGGGRAAAAVGRASQQHALTHQGLAERHSIAVPLGGALGSAVPSTSATARDKDAAPSKLSRSTDFKSAGANPSSGAGASTGSKSTPGTHRAPQAQGQAKSQTSAQPSSSPQQPQLTPAKPISSIDRAAASAVTPGVDPVQEKMARIIAAPPQGSGQGPAQPLAVAGQAGSTVAGGSCSPSLSPPTQPPQSQLAVVKELRSDVDCNDVQSPKDNAKAARTAGLAAGASKAVGMAAGGAAAGTMAAVVGSQLLLSGQQSKAGTKGAAVPPSPAKVSRIPRVV